MRRRHRFVLGFVVPTCVVAFALLVGPTLALRRLDALTAEPVLFCGALLAVALVRPLLAWPTTLLAVAVGYAFGLAGLPLAVLLIVVSSVPTFLFARSVGAESRIAETGRRAVDATGGVRGVTASRLAPAPSDVVSAGAGVAGVSLPTFAVGTAIGELPWAVAGVLAGDSMEALTADSLADVVDLRLLVAVGLIGALLVAGPVYRHLRGSPENE
jgi:uncharacterized membrane protein YdjX (TVP38/TMEM64 family)